MGMKMRAADGLGFRTIQDVAAALGLAYSTVYARVRCGIYPEPDKSIKGAKFMYYSAEDFNEIVRRHKQQD